MPIINTVQDKPTWSISTTRGFPTSEKTEFDGAKRALYEYPIFVSIYRELQNLPEGQVSQELENVATVFTNDWWVQEPRILQAKSGALQPLQQRKISVSP